MASRPRWSLALDVDERDVAAELDRRLATPVPPERVATGPVQEVRCLGDEVDLTRLPAYLQHELDAAPYISAALDVSRHPESGRRNIGVRRLMVRGPRETGIDLVAPSDLRGFYRRARERGEPLEVAFVIGAHPVDYMASQLKGPAADELETMGSLRQAPVPLVRCETVDLEVPADAEIVLEGHLEGDWDQVEGPFGEYHGCYGADHRNPVFKVSALTRRRDAIYQTATIGGQNLRHTDTAVLSSISLEAVVRRFVSQAVSGLVQVHCPPAATGVHHTRISLRVRDPGDARAALTAALASHPMVKLAVAVDDDVDVFDDAMTEWALATRFQADRDCTVLPGMPVLPLDPSLPPPAGAPPVGAKIALDATRRLDRPRAIFDVPLPPFADPSQEAPPQDGSRAPALEDIEDLADRVLATAGDGRRFVDWLRELPDVHEGDLVRALDLLRERGRLTLGEGGVWVEMGASTQDRAPKTSRRASRRGNDLGRR
jgi:2,5-furandicarboxylate decarboxylase 1